MNKIKMNISTHNIPLDTYEPYQKYPRCESSNIITHESAMYCKECDLKLFGYNLNKKQMKQPYQIRIDTELLDKVKESAKENERSVNAEIRYLLKCALAKK